MEIKNWKPREYLKGYQPRTIIPMSDREYIVMSNGSWVRIDRERKLIGRKDCKEWVK